MKDVILVMLFSYLIGEINPSYLIAKARGFDIREAGSQNAGGSNAVITMGKKVGVFCMLADILKTTFVIRSTMHMFPHRVLLWCVSAVTCTLGHMFPFYMQFRGGKGLACLGGTALALTPKLFPLLLAVAVVMAYIADYICIVPITMSIAYPILYASMQQDFRIFLIMAVMTVVMLLRHRENLKRIRLGTEARFSYLWNKEAETQRLKEARTALYGEEDAEAYSKNHIH